MIHIETVDWFSPSAFAASVVVLPSTERASCNAVSASDFVDMRAAYTTFRDVCNHASSFALITARVENSVMSNDSVSEFGKRLKKARESAGMGQAELGRAAGYPASTAQTRISNYEKGLREPALSDLATLASVLKMAPGLLAFGEQARAADGERPAVGDISPAQLALVRTAAMMAGTVPDKTAKAITDMIVSSAQHPDSERTVGGKQVTRDTIENAVAIVQQREKRKKLAPKAFAHSVADQILQAEKGGKA